MKTPHLLASFAVAALASAAEFKDPSEVARDWNEGTAPAKSLTGDLSLRGTITPPPAIFPSPQLPVQRDKSKDVFQVPPWGAPAPKRPGQTEPLIDAPRNPPPDELPNNMPPGAKAWKYGGQTYWLMPLIPSRPK